MTLTHNQNLWLAALRSGSYQQGRDHLRDLDDNFCCLGVACDLFHPEPPSPRDTVYKYSKEVCLAPHSVKEALLLRTATGLPNSVELTALTDLNDRGVTFEEIADIIEANPEEYFR